MKYINVTVGGMRGLVLFPDYLCHADVACCRQVHSAGFIDLDAMVCYGESVSLGVKSSPQDTLQLRAMAGSAHIDELPAILQRQAS